MPGLDMSGGASGTDYSDFEYQTLKLNNTAGGNGNVNSEFLYEVEPLGGIGGLDNDEVAELVHLEVHASIEPEDEKNDQDVATAADLRGIVGANINTLDGLTGIGNTIAKQGSGGGSGLEVSDDRVFQQFQARAVLPFDDQTNGPGGGSFDSFHNSRNFRRITGRGPVLDSTDDITVSGAIIGGDVLASVLSSSINIHLIYDTAHVGEAGRAFSVPDM
jgi:hypothetical protein